MVLLYCLRGEVPTLYVASGAWCHGLIYSTMAQRRACRRELGMARHQLDTAWRGMPTSAARLTDGCPIGALDGRRLRDDPDEPRGGGL